MAKSFPYKTKMAKSFVDNDKIVSAENCYCSKKRKNGEFFAPIFCPFGYYVFFRVLRIISEKENNSKIGEIICLCKLRLRKVLYIYTPPISKHFFSLRRARF